MNPKLRAMLVTMGMKKDASDEEAHRFMQDNGIAAIDVTGNSGDNNTDGAKRSEPDTAQSQQSVAENQQRVLEIVELGQKYGMANEARTAIEQGASVAEFKGTVLERKFDAKPVDIPSEIGMSNTEVRQYSLRKALLAHITNDWSDAGLEKEASLAVADQRGKKPQGFFMPYDVAASRSIDMNHVNQVRAQTLSVGDASYGGNLVDSSTMWHSMIDLLRNSNVLAQLGVQYLPGLVGDVVIPKKVSGASYFHVSEGQAVGKSDMKFSGMGMTPHTIGTFIPYTRKLLLQSSISIEQMIRAELMEVLSLGMQDMVLFGSGAKGEPRGVLNDPDVEVLALGANGLLPTRAHIIRMESKVEVNNALMGTIAYLTNAKVKGTLKETFINDSSDTPVWKDDNTMNGYKAVMTNSVPSDLKKGTSTNCSAISFGDWSRILIGLWSGMDFIVNPYSEDEAGNVKITVHADYDTVNRRPKSFCNVKDAKTNI
jgi:HK97 family phage major capsid protein